MPRPFARVLIADDEPIVRLDLRGMLEEHGFAVAGEAADGFDAVEGCRALAPDVALLDVRMPIFDGLEAAHTIVSEALAGCVVLLTAFGDREYIERAKEIGVAGYLVKPVDERQLAPTLEMAIASGARVRRAMDESAALRQKMNEHDTLEPVSYTHLGKRRHHLLAGAQGQRLQDDPGRRHRRRVLPDVRPFRGVCVWRRP